MTKTLSAYITAINGHLVGDYGMYSSTPFIKFAKFCLLDGVPAHEAAMVLKMDRYGYEPIHNTHEVEDEMFPPRKAYLLGLLHAFVAVSNRKV